MLLFRAIANGDTKQIERQLRRDRSLARIALKSGASRQSALDYFLYEIASYVYGGDTALHVAAAAYHVPTMKLLAGLGADVSAKNRRLAQPIHGATGGVPGSPHWNPKAQAEAIKTLIKLGADPNARAAGEVTPLHRAVRNRCAAAVKALLEHGANPTLKNKSGSTAIKLAKLTTGRGGTGSHEAKAQQEIILKLLGLKKQ